MGGTPVVACRFLKPAKIIRIGASSSVFACEILRSKSEAENTLDGLLLIIPRLMTLQVLGAILNLRMIR